MKKPFYWHDHTLKHLSTFPQAYQRGWWDEIEERGNLPEHIFCNNTTPIPIHNHSPNEIQLSFSAHRTLAYGLKFAPTPRRVPSDKVVFKHFNEFRYNVMNRYAAFVEGWKHRDRPPFNLKLKIKPKFDKRILARWGIILNFCEDVRMDMASQLNKLREKEMNSNDDTKGFKNMK